MRVQIDIVQCQALAEQLRTQHMYVQDACAQLHRAYQWLFEQSCDVQKELLMRAIWKLQMLEEELMEKERQLLRITEVYRSCEEDVLKDVCNLPEMPAARQRIKLRAVFTKWPWINVKDKIPLCRPAIYLKRPSWNFEIRNVEQLQMPHVLEVPNKVRDFVNNRMKRPLSDRISFVPSRFEILPGCPLVMPDWQSEEMRQWTLKWLEEYQRNKEGGDQDHIIGIIEPDPERLTRLRNERESGYQTEDRNESI